MRVLVPMAGPDAAFGDASGAQSKSLVEIDRKPLVQHVVENLATIADAEFVFVISSHDDKRFHLGSVLRLLRPNCRVVVGEGQTKGAACTALLAIEEIAADAPLIIANGDQILDVDLSSVVKHFADNNWDGGILTFRAVHPKWSYVRLDDDDMVIEAAEKRPISNHATAGLYYYRRGGDFVEAAMDMIRKGAEVEGGFYICPTFNELVLKGASIGALEVSAKACFKLSSPQAVREYEEHITKRR